MCSWHLVLNFSCGDFFNRMLKMFTSYLAARYDFTDPDIFSKQLQGFKGIAAREAKNSHLLKDFILFNLISRWIFCTDPLMISRQFYRISFEIVLWYFFNAKADSKWGKGAEPNYREFDTSIVDLFHSSLSWKITLSSYLVCFCWKIFRLGIWS